MCAPVYIVSLAIVAGDALGNFHLFVPPWPALALGLTALVVLVAGRAAVASALALVAIAAAATVPVRDLLVPRRTPVGIARYPDASLLTLEGRLGREVERARGRLHLFVSIERAAPAGAAPTRASGVVRVTVPGEADYRVGDNLRFTGKIRFPRNYGNPGEFDYESYQARQGVIATVFLPRASLIEVVSNQPRFFSTRIEGIRRHIAGFIDANLQYPEREEMRALIIGDRGGIDEALRNKFALTGMAHLLVISGLHLGFVASAAFGLLRLLCWCLPSLMVRGYANKLCAVGAGLAAISYAAIAGHHVSTVRALIMVLVYVGAVVFDRPREVLASLALAAAVICILLPGSTADIGFQLSFASVFAIILGMRRFSAWWKQYTAAVTLSPRRLRRRYLMAGIAAGYVAVSFWATLGTAPLTAFHFNQFSLVGPVANAVVVPIMGAGGTVGGLAACALSFVWELPAQLILHLAARCLAAGTWLAGWFERWPAAWMRSFTPTLGELAIAYSLLMLWLSAPLKEGMEGPRAAADGLGGPAPAPDPPDRRLLALRVRPKSSRTRARRVWFALLLAALVADAAWWTYQRFFNPDLRVTFLAVGQGDCAVLQLPGSRVMIVDGGGSFSDEFDPGERIVAPFLWSRKIMRVDYLVLSHPELDHFGGLGFVVRNFHPRQFWTIAAPTDDIRYQQLLEVLSTAHVPTKVMDTSAPKMGIGGVEISCLNPEPGVVASHNNSSMVLALHFGRNSFLFAGDLEARGERSLLERVTNLRAMVLKVPHHGSLTSSTDELVEKVHPAIAVISVGYLNRFHFPAAEVVDRYRRIGTRVLRTDQAGAVMIEAGRHRLNLWTWRRLAAFGADAP